jgi:5-methyltetrahydrofolate--homocysteine methyltransferase
MEPILKEIIKHILEGSQKEVETDTSRAIEAGISTKTILDEGLIAAMSEVGRLFDAGEFYVPEMLISARAMKAGLTLLKPYLVQSRVESAGRVALGTVQGDLHDIGKNLVGIMLEGAGFEVIDLGTDVSPEDFVHAVKKHKVGLLGLSALLTTTMLGMKSTLDALERAGLRKQVKVMVGGAPINEEFAKLIGADGYAPDASRAVGLARSLMSLGQN